MLCRDDGDGGQEQGRLSPSASLDWPGGNSRAWAAVGRTKKRRGEHDLRSRLFVPCECCFGGWNSAASPVGPDVAKILVMREGLVLACCCCAGRSVGSVGEDLEVCVIGAHLSCLFSHSFQAGGASVVRGHTGTHINRSSPFIG